MADGKYHYIQYLDRVFNTLERMFTKKRGVNGRLAALIGDLRRLSVLLNWSGKLVLSFYLVCSVSFSVAREEASMFAITVTGRVRLATSRTNSSFSLEV